MHLCRFALAFFTFCAAVPAPQAQSPQLIAQLDAASAKFKSVQASVQQDVYTKLVHDHDIQTGSIYVERAGGGQNMGAVLSSQGAQAVILNYGGGKLQKYTPGTNQDDIFEAGANQAKYESFLTLGFGGSGKDLENAWTITDMGAETMSDGSQQVKTEKLDLVSKDSGVRNTFQHVTIWIDPARGVSLKQIFYSPGGDTRTTVYTNIKLNSGIDKKPYAIPGKATKVSH